MIAIDGVRRTREGLATRGSSRLPTVSRQRMQVQQHTDTVTSLHPTQMQVQQHTHTVTPLHIHDLKGYSQS